MKKLILPLLLVVLLAGCGQKPADKTDFSLLAESTADSIVFPGVTWGMSKADALKALKLDESMLTPVEDTFDALVTNEMYDVKPSGTESVPDIRAVAFGTNGDIMREGSLIGITIGYTDKAELDEVIEELTTLYGDAKMEPVQDQNGNTDGSYLGKWSGKLTVRTVLGDKQEDFAAAYTKAAKARIDNPDLIRDMPTATFAYLPTTSANVVTYDKPDENGLVGFIQLHGLWDAQANQFISK